MSKTVSVLSMLKSLLKTPDGTAALAVGLENYSLADAVAEWVVRAQRITTGPEGEGGYLFTKHDPELPVSKIQVIVRAPCCPACQAEGPEIGVLFDPVQIELNGASLRGQEIVCRACGHKYDLVAA